MESMYETNYEPQTAGEVIGLIHIGAHYTSINVLRHFHLGSTWGGQEFTDSLEEGDANLR